MEPKFKKPDAKAICDSRGNTKLANPQLNVQLVC